MQINNKAHPLFFKTNNWADPIANAAQGYQIYLGRLKANGNGWSAWYAVKGLLWANEK